MKTKRFITMLFIAAFFFTTKAQYTKLLDFAGYTGSANGSHPQGSLISDGTFLYGMTSEGGTNNLGTIFKIMPDGSGYVRLLNFAGANGMNPQGSLIFDGTFLYGMTYKGGTSNTGTLFKVMPDGSGYVKLLDFISGATGRYPYGSLISDGTFLYGMTTYGGANNMGTVFKIMPDGSGYSRLLDFAGAANGNRPYGSLISDGTFLYGTTYQGGANDLGTVFKIMPDGSGYVKLLDFAGAANGKWTTGSLISDGTFLYGTTQVGGTNDLGTLFKIMPDGSGYVKLLEFAGSNGANPQGSLISDGTFLYGMTYKGGLYSRGTIFKIMTDGSGYEKLFDFTGTADGGYPWDSFISDGTFLYGMTPVGGINNLGVIFKYKPLVSVSGNIISETVIPVPGVTVTLSGNDNQTATTDSTGHYNFSVAQGGNYTITPSKFNDSIINNGVTSLDVLLMRKHILGVAPLPSPYKIIAAAEVNADGDTTITTQDILFTRSLILGNINSFPTNRLWQFVSSDYVFPDNNHPFPFPTSRTYTNITTNQTNQNFIGIKLGDVNGSWDAGVP